MGKGYNSNWNICCITIIAMIFIGAIIAVRTLYYSSSEPYTSYQQEIKDLARSKDIAKDKYPFQNVSQDSVTQQQTDYEQTYIEPAILANKYRNLHPEYNDLLPVDQPSNEWSRANPQGTGSLELQNMLDAGTHIGVDTQGSSLKNANQQLRSEPPNPIIPVSIFNNSTIVPDIYRKELEIGES